MRLTVPYKLIANLLVLVGVIALVMFVAPPAQAAGWWQIDASDTVGSGIWNVQEDNSSYASPHGGFSSTSNLCKTCHAVHMAGEDSHKLLKDGSIDETRTQGEWTTPGSADAGKGNHRSTECMYCHDANSGATSKKPYELAILTGETVRGEHTLGVTTVPDSDINNAGQETGILGRTDPAAGQGKVLQCWQCHSVHGANTIGTTNAVEGKVYDSSDVVENWNTKILRVDPANDGTVLAKGSGGLSAAVWEAELDTDAAAVRTGFCADCHNLNPNWEIDSDDTTRPNNRSHVQGPGTDSFMEVYGTTKAVAAHPLEELGCRGCHFASLGGGGTGISRFPHQSRGWKLLFDEATMTGGTSDLAGDPQRIIPGMDTICLSCHAVFEDLDLASGVGLCLNCHDSKYAAQDVGDEIRKASGMGITDVTRDHAGEEGVPIAFSGPIDRHAQCSDCHNAQEIFPWRDMPLKEMWGVEIVSESWDATPTLQKVDLVSSQDELCFKCHASDTGVGGSGWDLMLPSGSYYLDSSGTTLPTENKAFAFNANNSSYHPVRTQGRNQSEALRRQLESGTTGTANQLTTTSMIKCTDCHNSDETGATQGPAASYSGVAPNGPHGSDEAPLLRARYLSSVSTTDLPATPITLSEVGQNFALCFLCHDINRLMSPNPATFATNFSKNGTENLHYRHLLEIGEDPGGGLDPDVGGVPVCRVCHYDIHSNQQADNTQYRYWDGISLTLSDTPIQGTKTRLIGFAPGINTPQAYAKPALYYNSDNRDRRCYLICHLPKYGQPGTEAHTMGGRLYTPNALLDSDPLTYTP